MSASQKPLILGVEFAQPALKFRLKVALGVATQRFDSVARPAEDFAALPSERLLDAGTDFDSGPLAAGDQGVERAAVDSRALGDGGAVESLVGDPFGHGQAGPLPFLRLHCHTTI
jgi:hypothetical protein